MFVTTRIGVPSAIAEKLDAELKCVEVDSDKIVPINLCVCDICESDWMCILYGCCPCLWC